jgi:hypothetical protein
VGSFSPAHAAQSVTLAWNRDTDPTVVGYRLHDGTSSGNYTRTIEVGNTTTATVSNLTAGQTYYFAVTAYNAVGRESLPSNQVSFTATATPTPVLGHPANYISYSGDFNRDGKQDVLWRNVNTGNTWIWLMNGSSIIGSASIGHVDLSWKIVGIGDFNGGGKRDIVWYNASSGLVSIWIMDGFTQTGNYLFQAPAPVGGEWEVVGVADFDHTGLADILWEDIHTGIICIWKSVSPFRFSTIYLYTVDPIWRVAGTADIEGNGRPDIIWRNLLTGQVDIWKLTNDHISQSVSLGKVSLDYQIVGLADFNGDGKQDILWRSVSSGHVHVWGMNGLSVGAQWYAGTASLEWVIVGTPALYGTSPSDVLWLNPTTGSVAAWKGTPTLFSQLPPFATAGPGDWPMPQPE